MRLQPARLFPAVIITAVAVLGGSGCGAPEETPPPPECTAGETRRCGTLEDALDGVGVCSAGTQPCVDGSWAARCDGEVLPGDEDCNGLDDDCDGVIDEDLGTVGCGQGVCAVTVPACDGGAPNTCVPGTPSGSEACDGVDDDCDGAVDEGCACIDGEELPCYTGAPATIDVGACRAGLATCRDGLLGGCVGEILPGAELCDGVDNDCDGSLDDDGVDVDVVGAPCDGVDADLCGEGTFGCVGGDLVCGDDSDDTGEACNGVDDDCDGTTDEGCACLNGETTGCYSGPPGSEGVGDCHAGTRRCVDGSFTDCEGEQVPGAELCDAADNDCNGITDDAVTDPLAGQPCEGADSDLCVEGVIACEDAELRCTDLTASTIDLCNGADDDCDAASTDGSEDPLNGEACDGFDADLCLEGLRSCVAGALACSDDSSDDEDVCNGLDDDCDPASPDGSEDPVLGTACDGPDSDLCAEGLRVCTDGALACSDTTGGAVDVCNGLNDDCDPASPDGSEDPQNGSTCDGPDTDLCKEGLRSCFQGALVCSDATTNTVEICQNGLDDDCDPATTDNC